MDYTRRDMGKIALASLPAAKLRAAKPNSIFGGVQVGANVPYIFRNMPGSADDILKYLLQTNISAVELRTQPVEAYLGAPAPAAAARGGGAGAARAAAPAGAAAPAAPAAQRGAAGGGRAPLTPEQQAAQRAAADELRKWRLSRSMNEFKAFRKKYEDAGVLIQIVKVDGFADFTDDVTDYFFQAARALGAYAMSCEIPVSKTKRIGAFAEKHKMMVGYHGHGNLTDPEAFGRLGAWEQAFWYSKYNGANVDIGHFFASNGFSPAQWIKENHTRITHIHLKDRKANNGPNMPWGQGDTPLKEVLQMVKAEKYKFQATIEMEHPVPAGSNTLAELAKCVEYCKQVLA
jgi:hypothetical protein